MRLSSNVHHRLALALLVGIVAVPITSTALFIHQDIASPEHVSVEELRKSALQDRSRLRAQRRLYWQVVERMESGEINIEKPDVNDTAVLEDAMQETEEQVHAAAVEKQISLTARDLSSADRHLLRRYTRAGFCPESLKDFRVEGFYELCRSQVGSKVKSKPVMGLLNHNANLYKILRPSAPNVSGFKKRMEMMQQARDRSTRREDTTGPNRPKVCVANPLCHLPRYNN